MRDLSVGAKSSVSFSCIQRISAIFLLWPDLQQHQSLCGHSINRLNAAGYQELFHRVAPVKPPVDVLITATKRLRCSSLSLIPTFFVDLRLSWSYVLIPATSDMWQPDFVTFMILMFAALDKYEAFLLLLPVATCRHPWVWAFLAAVLRRKLLFSCMSLLVPNS